MIIDDFDGLVLGPAIYCTYCWTIHYDGEKPCGPDRWRELDNKEDYLAYTRQYQANGFEHKPLGSTQMPVLIK